MSISPAMLNRAKRIPLREIVCHFEGKEYTTYLPAKPFITVQQFLDSFAKNNVKKKNCEYFDLELVKHQRVMSYDYIIHKETFASKYDVHLSELTQESFLKKLNFSNKFFDYYEEDWYPMDEVNLEGKSDNRKNNFFTYLIDRYPIYKLKEEEVNHKLNLKNIFNSEVAKMKAEENMRKVRNQWLYNRFTFPHLVTPLNIQAWDSFYYKNMLTQILSTAIVDSTQNFELDVDSSIKGVHTREKQVDFMIRNKSTGFNIPLNIVKEIDEVELFDVLRLELYNYLLPKDYPNFIYELVDYEDPNQLTEEVMKKVDKVNNKYCKYIFYLYKVTYFKLGWRRAIARLMEQRSFDNFDTLKIMSKSRFNMARKIQIGISAYNDKFRFNLFKRNGDNHIENETSLHRSPIFDLEISPGETTIKNVKDFTNFLEIFRVVNNLSPELIDSAYDDFILETKVLENKLALKMEKRYRKIENYEGLRDLVNIKAFNNDKEKQLKISKIIRDLGDKKITDLKESKLEKN